jgi:RNA 3'-terminal phosphate cyclase (ATP)
LCKFVQFSSSVLKINFLLFSPFASKNRKTHYQVPAPFFSTLFFQFKIMIEIDGERHEGGGQSVRLAVALSVVLKKSCRIFNIRKKRSRPGLANQHIAGINLVEELAGCEFLDQAGCPVEIGSTSCFINAEEINYSHRIKKFTADAHTAGSIALVAQVALPVSY